MGSCYKVGVLQTLETVSVSIVVFKNVEGFVISGCSDLFE